MTGDANADNQSALLRAGANDLVLKPIEERLLVTKTLFQLRLSRMPEQRSARRMNLAPPPDGAAANDPASASDSNRRGRHASATT